MKTGLKELLKHNIFANFLLLVSFYNIGIWFISLGFSPKCCRQWHFIRVQDEKQNCGQVMSQLIKLVIMWNFKGNVQIAIEKSFTVKVFSDWWVKEKDDEMLWFHYCSESCPYNFGEWKHFFANGRKKLEGKSCLGIF